MKLKAFLFLLLLMYMPKVYAYSDYIIASGKNIGININSKGAIVVGFYKINDDYIAKESGLKVGDIITSVNDSNVNSILDFTSKVNTSVGDVKIGYIRDDMQKYTNLKLYKDDSNNFKTGIYVKDSISGIGTLTYIDPNSKIFGALGHEIVDTSTGNILNNISGNIFDSKVTSIKPSTNGLPGEKNAKIFNNEILGNILENTNKGIYGNYNNNYDDSKLYKVANFNDIKLGEAKILTVLKDNIVDEYEIKIIKVNNNPTKNILFEITDQELLNSTNGIIQGMSGSPIIQDDYILGAVTHVVVDNPHKGYGIFITNMLEEGEN